MWFDPMPPGPMMPRMILRLSAADAGGERAAVAAAAAAVARKSRRSRVMEGAPEGLRARRVARLYHRSEVDARAKQVVPKAASEKWPAPRTICRGAASEGCIPTTGRR